MSTIVRSASRTKSVVYISNPKLSKVQFHLKCLLGQVTSGETDFEFREHTVGTVPQYSRNVLG